VNGGPTGQPFAPIEPLARWADTEKSRRFVPLGDAQGWENGGAFGPTIAAKNRYKTIFLIAGFFSSTKTKFLAVQAGGEGCLKHNLRELLLRSFQVQLQKPFEQLFI
jgi:hypothetical protein